jgi:hypothetical protein
MSAAETLAGLMRNLNFDSDLSFGEFDEQFDSMRTAMTGALDEAEAEADMEEIFGSMSSFESTAAIVEDNAAVEVFADFAVGAVAVASMLTAVYFIFAGTEGTSIGGDRCDAGKSVTFKGSQRCEPFTYVRNDPNTPLFQSKDEVELVIVSPLCGSKDPKGGNPVNCGIPWTCDGVAKFTKLTEANSWSSQVWTMKKKDDGTLDITDARTLAPIKFPEAAPVCRGSMRMPLASSYTTNPPGKCYDVGDVHIEPNSFSLLKVPTTNNYVEYTCGDDDKKKLFLPELKAFDANTYLSVTRGSSGDFMAHSWKVPDIRQGYPCDMLEATDCCLTTDNLPGICADYAGSGNLSCFPHTPSPASSCIDHNYDCDIKKPGDCCRLSGYQGSPIGFCADLAGSGGLSCFPILKNGDMCHNHFEHHKNIGACSNPHEKLNCASNMYSCFEGTQPALGQCNGSASYFQAMKSCASFCKVV